MADGRKIVHHGEAIVLRTWPFHEADLLVSLFTREQGKIKGVARYAMRSRRRFGGALEAGTHVLAHYTELPKQDLVRLDSFEILWSPLATTPDYLQVAAMQLVVEVLDEALPDLATDDNIFRLALTTLQAVGRDYIWMPVTYFAVWMNRLMGWLPELGLCSVCGLDLSGESVWWSHAADGVVCADDRRTRSNMLSALSVALSYQIARSSLPVVLEQNSPTRERSAELLAFAVGLLERHLQRRLRSAHPLH